MNGYKDAGLVYLAFGSFFLGAGIGMIYRDHPAGWAFISGAAIILVCGAMLVL